MNTKQSNDYNRRDFLKGSSVATLMAMMGGIELRAEDAPKASTNAEPALTVIPVGPTVKYGIIGLGPWAREVITELGKMPNAPVVAICDKYPSALRRASESAPKAEKFEDYKKLLESKEVQAVIVATPTHQHREIVCAALAAGKHVYCEAPIGCSIEDAKAIAQAAKAAVKVVFQSGLQLRAYPKRKFLVNFLRAGAIGRPLMARAQYHKKQSWRRPSPNPEREAEINWRLSSKTSTGLVGELGIHQLDLISWLLKSRPTAVTGYGANILWNDGRDVPDTVQALFEYPGGATFSFDATIGNSFDADYEMVYGEMAAVMIRNTKAWMFKEVDSPLLGWEVYARKDSFFGETGISLAAGATGQKALKAGEKAGVPQDAYPNSPLFYGLETFTANVGLVGGAVADFIDNFKGGDKESALDESEAKALQEQLATLKIVAYPGWKEGFEATVVAIKANEAIVKKERIVLKNEWFEV